MTKEKPAESKKEAPNIARRLGFLLNPYKNLLKDADKKPEETEQKAQEIEEPNKTEEQEEQVEEKSELEKPVPSLDSKPRLGKVLWKKK